MRSHRLTAVFSSAVALLLVPVAGVPLARFAGPSEATTTRSWSSAATTKLLATDGSLIARLHGEVDRDPVPLDRIPKHVRNAVIAIEDRRFWRHNGIDMRGLARAAVSNLKPGRGLQGGSTITQQLVKNVHLRGQTRNVVRKGVEAFLAFGMEQALSKEKILEAYLNTVYFGRGVYGVQSAAGSYFHKDVSELTLSESAFLAGLIHLPARYDWANSDTPATQSARKTAAISRRDLVLRVMRDRGYASPHELRSATQSPVRIQPPADPNWRHPYFVDAALREIGVLRNQHESRPDPRFDFLGSTFDERARNIYAGGLQIRTTMDVKTQRDAEAALAAQLPEGTLPKLAAAVVTLQPGTGYIRALIGGRNYYPEQCEGEPANVSPSCRHAKVNLALGPRAGGSGRQAGSAFKPFALATALEHGVSLKQEVNSSPFVHEYDGERWKVSNYDGAGGGTMSIVDATVRSVNAAFARLVIEHIGKDKATDGSRKVAAVARRLGMPFPTAKRLRETCGDDYNVSGACTPADNVPAIALGAKEVSPLDMAGAYASFANEGVYAKPTTIAMIRDASGKVLYRAAPERRRAVKRSTALGVSHVLQQAVQRGTGRAAKLDRPVAGKTGTSQQWRDAWFAGYVPQLASVVWVGNPALVPTRDGRSTLESLTPANGYPTRIVGGSYPARIWGAHMAETVERLPVQTFAEPPKELFKKPKPVKDSGAPGVVGMSRAAAQILLRRAGFSVRIISACPPGGSSSGMSVWRQVAEGKSVTLWTSRAVCR